MPPSELQHDGAPVDKPTLAEFFAVTVDTVNAWVRTGRIVEIVPGRFDLNDAVGRVRAAARRDS